MYGSTINPTNMNRLRYFFNNFVLLYTEIRSSIFNFLILYSWYNFQALKYLISNLIL